MVDEHQPGNHLVMVVELLLGSMAREQSILTMGVEHLTVAGIELLLGPLEQRHRRMVFNRMVSLQVPRRLVMEAEIRGVQRLQHISIQLQLVIVGAQINHPQIAGAEILTMHLLLERICQLLPPQL